MTDDQPIPFAGSPLTLSLAAQTLLVIAVVFGLFAVVFHQGFHMVLDGQWLLGGQLLANGGSLPRDLVTHDGLGRYWLLKAWPEASASGLAMLKALLAAVTAGAGFLFARRMGAGAFAWIVPVGVVALGGSEPGWCIAAVLVALLSGGGNSRIALVAAGALAGWMLWFGVFFAGLGLALMAAAWRSGDARGRGMSLGAWLVLVLWLVVPVIRQGDLATVWAEHVQHVAMRWWQTDPGPHHAWWNTLTNTERLGRPFANVFSGESLSAAWPAHGTGLIGATWLRLALALSVGPTAWFALRSRTGGTLAAIMATGTLVASLTYPGNAQALAHNFVGVLLAAPLLLTRWSKARPLLVPLCTVMLMTGAFLPSLAENLWLVLNQNRSGLVEWDQPRAKVRMSEAWVDNLESVFARFTNSDGEVPPMLIWPRGSGLHALLGVPLVTRQATLLAGDNAGAAFDELQSNPPITVLLGLNRSFTGRSIARDSPDLWDFFRINYAVRGNVEAAGSGFRVLTYQSGGADALAQLTLPQRLPDLELSVANEAGPRLRPGLTVGQSVQTGRRDLAGVAVRWSLQAPAPGQAEEMVLPIRVRIWQKREEKYDALLEFFDVSIAVPRDQHRSYLRFGPVLDSAGKDLAITFELREETEREVALYWHRHDHGGVERDFYPEGDALLNLRPTAADLYFFVF